MKCPRPSCSGVELVALGSFRLDPSLPEDEVVVERTPKPDPRKFPNPSIVKPKKGVELKSHRTVGNISDREPMKVTAHRCPTCKEIVLFEP